MKTNTVAAAFAAAFVGSATVAVADTGSTELPAVVVEATRIGTSAGETPADVRVITREEIAASGARDIADLLEKRVPGVHVSGLGGTNPALKQISMRGWGENGFGRLAVIVDGERINNPDMSTPDLSRIDLGSVRQIEVIGGPGTVLHGDGATAGVINIVTEPEGYDTHGKVEVRGGSWNTLGVHGSLRGGFEETLSQYWMAGGWDHSDGYRSRSGYDLWNYTGGVKQNFDNGSFLKASVFYNDADYELPGALTRAEWHGHPTQGGAYDDDHYRRTAYGLNLTGKLVLDEDNYLKLTATASRRHMRSKAYGYWHVDYDMYSYEVTPEWVNTTDLFGFENEFLLGTTFRYDRLHAKTTGPVKYELNRETMGFYGQDTFHLTDELALQAGLRYQRVWNENTQLRSPRGKEDEFAYEFALLYRPVEDLKTYAKFSRFFRNPFLDEYASRSYVPDELVDPERGWSVDVGGDWQLPYDFSVAANAYVTKTKHEIMYDPWFLMNNVNYRGDTIREGFNLRAAWEYDKLAGVAIDYAFTDAKFDGGDYDGKDVPMVPKSTVALTGKVWLWDDCHVFGGYRYQSYMWSVSDFRNDGAYGGSKSDRVPAYGLFHIGVEYAPHYAAVKGLKIGFTIDNLFDRNYCEYATYGSNYYPGAGRSYMLRISYEF